MQRLCLQTKYRAETGTKINWFEYRTELGIENLVSCHLFRWLWVFAVFRFRFGQMLCTVWGSVYCNHLEIFDFQAIVCLDNETKVIDEVRNCVAVYVVVFWSFYLQRRHSHQQCSKMATSRAIANQNSGCLMLQERARESAIPGKYLLWGEEVCVRCMVTLIIKCIHQTPFDLVKVCVCLSYTIAP